MLSWRVSYFTRTRIKLDRRTHTRGVVGRSRSSHLLGGPTYLRHRSHRPDHGRRTIDELFIENLFTHLGSFCRKRLKVEEADSWTLTNHRIRLFFFVFFSCILLCIREALCPLHSLGPRTFRKKKGSHHLFPDIYRYVRECIHVNVSLCVYV